MSSVLAGGSRHSSLLGGSAGVVRSVTSARYSKEGARKQAVENYGTLPEGLGVWLLSDVDVMKHERFSYNCCSFFNVSCTIFFLSLNVNALVNKYFLSMKSKCVAAFKVGWLIF